MGRQRKWVGDDLWNILNLPIPKLKQIYPDYSKGTLKGKKAYWKKKLKNGEIKMPDTPEREPEVRSGQLQEPPVGRLYKTWEVSAYDQAAGEWTTATNHGYDYSPTADDMAEVFEPAAPAKISPTKRKRAERLGSQILVFGDSQIGYRRVYDSDGESELVPTHSEEALSVIQQVNADLRPETVVNLSDTIDLAEFSRFDPDSDNFHRTLSPSFQRVHDFYAQLRADNPDARLVEVDSNHTTRVHKAILKNMPSLYGFTLPGEDYPLLSYYRLANLSHMDVEFIPGYGAAEYVYGEEYGRPPIVFKHGVKTSGTPGGTVRKELAENPETHIVRGHGHSHEHVTKTNRAGDYQHYIQLGTSCATDGRVPSYGSAIDDHGHPVRTQENWQNQFMVITDYQGQYQFDVVDIIGGVAYYRGNTYDGNE